MSICKHFDSAVDTGSLYYIEQSNEYMALIKRIYVDEGFPIDGEAFYRDEFVYNFYSDEHNGTILNLTLLNEFSLVKHSLVNNSCIGEIPGKKLDQCMFNEYLRQFFSLKIRNFFR